MSRNKFRRDRTPFDIPTEQLKDPRTTATKFTLIMFRVHTLRERTEITRSETDIPLCFVFQ